jgi:cation diffusion facilitator family transporter
VTVHATVEERHAQMQQEKSAVARNSLFAAIGITSLKAIVAVTTGSLGLISETAHSALDLIAALITYLTIQVSDKPADADHQYGHGKFENFSAFLETGLLLITCVWIVYEALRRLLYHEVHVTPSLAAYSVLAVSMLVDWWRSRRLNVVAQRWDSQALEADALHFSTDIWSSAVVILGLVFVYIGQRSDYSWLRKADPIAALIVAGIVVQVSWRLARQTIDALLDAAPTGVRNKIVQDISHVDGVVGVDQVRIRRAGNRYFADVYVALERGVTFQRSEQVVANVTESVQQSLPDADVTVRSIPRASGHENIFDRIRAVAFRHNLGVHDLSIQDLKGKLHLEQHLELREDYTLKQAHDMVTQIEAEMLAEVPEVSSILTHIESEPATIESGQQIVRDPALEKRLRRLAKEFPEIKDIHEIVLKNVRHKLYLSCHCTFSDDLPLASVHDICTALEIRMKNAEPHLFKVLIHPEPITDNRR